MLKCKEHRALYKGTSYQLTSIETELLKYFLRHPKQLCNKESLAQVLALKVSTNTLNTLEVHVRKLRRKLHLTRRDHTIETVYGLGYRLNPPYA